MPRFLIRFLLALAALALVGGACSSSGDDDDAADEDQSEVDESADEEPSDDEAASEDGRDNAIGVIEEMGFTGEGAECIADSLEDSGIDLAELDLEDAADPGGDLGDALAQAGADCVEVIGDDLPVGSTDLSNPEIYDAFVEGFASTSGLGTEVATCVADYLLENDIDPAEAVSGDASALTDAVSGCQ